MLQRNITRLRVAAWTLSELSRIKSLLGDKKKVAQVATRHLESYAHFVGANATTNLLQLHQAAERHAHNGDNADLQQQHALHSSNSSLDAVRPLLLVSLPSAALSQKQQQQQLFLYDPIHDTILGTWDPELAIEDPWSLCSTVASQCGTSVVIVPCPLKDDDRPLLQFAVSTIAPILRDNGLNVVAKTSSDDILRLCGPPRPTVDDSSGPLVALKSIWTVLTEVASHITEDRPELTTSSSSTGGDVVSGLLVPNMEPILIQLVRLRSSRINMVCMKPRRTLTARPEQWSCGGSLSDVLAVLLRLPRHICLIPTSHTNRELLYACRAALQRSGKVVTIVFSTQFTNLEAASAAVPVALWQGIVKENQSSHEAALLRVREASGAAIRDEIVGRMEAATTQSIIRNVDSR